jgi:hypothetical protein
MLLILIPNLVKLNSIYQFEKYFPKYLGPRKETGNIFCDINKILTNNFLDNLAGVLHDYRSGPGNRSGSGKMFYQEKIVL